MKKRPPLPQRGERRQLESARLRGYFLAICPTAVRITSMTCCTCSAV